MNKENLLRLPKEIIMLPGFVGLVIGILGVLILFRKLLLGDSLEVLWGSDFDTNLMIWILEWGYHILVEQGNPSNFWNANSFYPHKGSLAFSDSMISAQLLYSPLRYLGISKLPSIYGTLIGFTLISCILTDFVLNKIGIIKIYERAIVVYVSHFCMSITTFMEIHYQLFGFQLAAPFFLYYFLFLNSGQYKYLFIATLILVVASGFSTYFAPMAGTIAIILTLIMLKKSGLRLKLSTKSLVYIISSAISIFILFTIQYEPYIKLISGRNTINWQEIITYSANPLSIINSPSADSVFYSSNVINGYWESSYFPGYILLSLTILGIGYLIVNYYKNKNANIGLKIGTFYIKCTLVLFFLAWIFSLGPVLSIDYINLKIYLPYALFAKFVPGFDAIRAPGRFGILLSLPIGILSLYGFNFIFLKLRSLSIISRNINKYLIYSLLLSVLIFDSMLHGKTYPFVLDRTKEYNEIKSFIDEKEPVAILPIFKNGHIETILNYMSQLIGSNIHNGWIIAGYGSKSTPELDKFVDLDRKFQNKDINFKGFIDEIYSMQVGKIIVFRDDYNYELQNQIDNYFKSLKNSKSLKINNIYIFIK
jgi:hypothetical protein